MNNSNSYGTIWQHVSFLKAAYLVGGMQLVLAITLIILPVLYPVGIVITSITAVVSVVISLSAVGCLAGIFMKIRILVTQNVFVLVCCMLCLVSVMIVALTSFCLNNSFEDALPEPRIALRLMLFCLPYAAWMIISMAVAKEISNSYILRGDVPSFNTGGTTLVSHTTVPMSLVNPKFTDVEK